MTHNGINFRGLARAMRRNIINMKLVEGGSTITQQLAKQLMTEDWSKRSGNALYFKAMETFFALDLEKSFSKEQILLMYVNIIYFGQGQYGIESASQFFFNKPAAKLDLPESAFLAGLIAAYVKFNPFKREKIETDEGTKYQVVLKATKDLKDPMERHKRVLSTMLKYNSVPEITTEQQVNELYDQFWKKYLKIWEKPDEKRNTQVGLIRQTNKDMEYIMEEVYRELTQFNDEMSDMLVRGGLTIRTTIDQRKQLVAQKVVRKHIQNYQKDCKKSLKNVDSSLIQGALISVDPLTGKIETMVGGTGYNRNKKNGQIIRSHQAYRQVGSAFKPILFETALELPLRSNTIVDNVFNPYLMVDDLPKVTINLPGMPSWTVRNFGQGEGKISLKRALQKSSNTVAAQLVEKIGKIGVDNLRLFLGKALRLSWNIEDKNSIEKRFPNNQYSIALGAKEMSPLELATVYSIIANKGVRVTPFFY